MKIDGQPSLRATAALYWGLHNLLKFQVLRASSTCWSSCGPAALPFLSQGKA